MHVRLLTLALATSLVAPACGSNRKAASGPTVAAAPTVDLKDRKAWAEENNLELEQFDLNRDQAPDVFKFYRMVEDPKAHGAKVEQLARKDVDLNNDGKIDVIRLYGDKGELTEERTDLDFDGRFDDVSLFTANQLTTKSLDLDYDGRADVVRYYAEGKVQRIESDRNNDGKVDTWEYFEGGVLDRIGTDLDADGNVDKWEKQQTAAQAPDAATETTAETPTDAGNETPVANEPAATPSK